MSAREASGQRVLRERGESAAEPRRGRRERAELAQRLLPPRLVLLALAGLLLFGYPFVAVFSRPWRIAGVPVLFVYLFAAWGLFILAIARLVDSGGRRP